MTPESFVKTLTRHQLETLALSLLSMLGTKSLDRIADSSTALTELELRQLQAD